MFSGGIERQDELFLLNGWQTAISLISSRDHYHPAGNYLLQVEFELVQNLNWHFVEWSYAVVFNHYTAPHWLRRVKTIVWKQCYLEILSNFQLQLLSEFEVN